MKLAHVALLGAAGPAVALLAAVPQPAGAHSAPAPDRASGRITVVGTGSTFVVPDRASFSFGTVSQAGTAAAALRSSAETVAHVVAALRAAGVAKPNLIASDRDASYRDALASALAQARAKAEQLARGAGAKLGRITAVTETGGTPQPVFAAADGSTSPIQVEPGTQEVGATVTVTFVLE